MTYNCQDVYVATLKSQTQSCGGTQDVNGQKEKITILLWKIYSVCLLFMKKISLTLSA